VFEREIQTEKQRLLRLLLPETEPFVPLQRILSLPDSELPYKRYFWAEIQWQLYDEELLHQRHPYFDYSAPELQPLLQRVRELLPRYARFPRSEVEALVDSAVKVRLNFLCRPRTTLKWFVFRGEPLKHRGEILRRLDYLSDYPYLLAGIRHHIQQLELGTETDGLISVVEFERIVQLVDETVLELTPSQFLQLLQPLETFFRITSLDALPQHLPTAALVIFLDDKGIRFLAHELEELLRRQHLRWISHAQFLELVTRLLEELEAPTDTHTLPLEFPELDHPDSEPPQRLSPAATNCPPPLEERPGEEPEVARPPESPPEPAHEEPASAEVAPSPAPVSHPGDTDPVEALFPEVLAEWLSPSAPAEVLWHDGTLDPDILHLTWHREFPADPEALRALPTPPPAHHPEQISREEPPPPAASVPEYGAPPSLAQLLSAPTWRRRYLHTLFATEEALSALAQALLQCAHWKAAAATIDRFFAAYGIAPDSRPAVLFREEILRHYGENGGHDLR